MNVRSTPAARAMPETLISVPSETALLRARRRAGGGGAESAWRPLVIALVRGFAGRLAGRLRWRGGCSCDDSVPGRGSGGAEAGMPRPTGLRALRWRRATATASSDGGAFDVAEWVMFAFDLADEPPDAGDLFFGRGRVRASPFHRFPRRRRPGVRGAQQVVEIAGEVGQVGHVGAEVVTAGAAEPDRAGAAAGFSRWNGSPQVPYGTATVPIAYRACALSSSVAAVSPDAVAVAGRTASR